MANIKTGLIITGDASGAFLAGGWLNEFFGWRVAFMVVGIPGILLAIIVRLTIAEPARGLAGDEPLFIAETAPQAIPAYCREASLLRDVALSLGAVRAPRTAGGRRWRLPTRPSAWRRPPGGVRGSAAQTFGVLGVIAMVEPTRGHESQHMRGIDGTPFTPWRPLVRPGRPLRPGTWRGAGNRCRAVGS